MANNNIQNRSMLYLSEMKALELVRSMLIAAEASGHALNWLLWPTPQASGAL